MSQGLPVPHTIHSLLIFPLLPRRPRRRDLLVQRQDIRHGTDGRDGERVDLRVRLGVVLLDVGELGRGAEGRFVPVEVAKPPVETPVSG